MQKFFVVFVVFVVFVLFVGSVSAERVEGVLAFEFGDGKPPSKEYYQKYYLQTPDANYPLSLSNAFENRMPIRKWSGKNVAVTFKSKQLSVKDSNGIVAIELLEGRSVNGGVLGSQPWVSILCKFSDVNDEPEDLSYFQDMYANLPSGLDHYWREVSYDNIDVVGSLAVDWVDLPKTQTEYIANPGGGDDADLNLLFDDCTAAANPFVNYATGAGGTSFVGINMMFNELLDCCAWGGARNATLNGLNKTWRTTWNPPWSFANEGVIAHEMGHGFGLPHANNSDGDGDPYDSPWDVMSAATTNGVLDSVFGRLGKHINMYYKHYLGWVDDSDGYIVNPMTDDVFLVVYSSRATTGGAGRFARIPLSDGSQYMVEVRKESGNYESNLPGTAVIIHHVVQGRSEPPWIVDQDVPPASFSNNEGVMWKTGETFFDPIDGYEVEVLGLFDRGFNVRITGPDVLDDLIFANGFEQ